MIIKACIDRELKMNKRRIRNREKLIQYLASISIIGTAVSDDEELNIILDWRERFISNWEFLSKREKSQYSCDFDFLNPKYKNEIAIDAYSKRIKYPIEYYIRVQWQKGYDSIVECSGVLPDYKLLREAMENQDTYVIPKRMNWSFVITHEGDYVNDPFYCEPN
jgi:hypothetical protein